MTLAEQCMAEHGTRTIGLPDLARQLDRTVAIDDMDEDGIRVYRFGDGSSLLSNNKRGRNSQVWVGQSRSP